MLLLAVQQYDMERLKKDGDAEKEREATLREERWGSEVTHECACCMCVWCVACLYSGLGVPPLSLQGHS